MLRDPGLVPLSHDHHRALALCVFTRRALARDGGAENVSRQARRIVEQFDSEIRDHFEFEERVLFPALEGHPSVAELVVELMLEHRTLYSLIGDLREGGGRAAVEEFCEVLRGHVRKEERLLFEEAQRLLTRAELDAIGVRRRSGPACAVSKPE